MAARYAGDIFYRAQKPVEETEFGKKSLLMQRYPELKLWTPAQKKFQDQYKLVAEKARQEYVANE